MFQWRIHMEIRGGGDAMRQEWPQIKADAMSEMGEKWHSEYLPLHFSPFAATKYGYQDRSYSYRQRKRRVHGHDTPLVYSGTLKHDVMAWAEVRTSADETSVIMRSNVLNLVGRRQSDPSYPDIKAELTAVAPEEPDRFAQWVDQRATQKLQDLEQTAVSF